MSPREKVESSVFIGVAVLVAGAAGLALLAEAEAWVWLATFGTGWLSLFLIVFIDYAKDRA